jgi:sodium-dependent dicarboxylate transporter 2/3/5
VTDAGSGHHVRRVGLFLGPAVGALLIALPLFVPQPGGLSDPAVRALGVAALVSIWWVTEALPLPATALVPAALFPLLGVASAKELAPSFAHPFVLLLLAGFMLAMAVEHTGAHRRVALHVLRWVGPAPRRLVLGFSLSATLISMWISNTATALILMPVAMALADHARAHASAEAARTFGVAVVLAVAYGASIGGLGTPVGTVANLIAIGALEQHYPTGPSLTFLEWASAGVPIALVMMFVLWAVLVFVSPRVVSAMSLGASDLIDRELAALGPWRASERRALGLFAVAALLWITREDVTLGEGQSLAGWSTRLGFGASPDDATVAMFLVVLAFLIPSGERDGKPLLTWSIANKAPWDLFLLFGGGITLAVGFDKTGVSTWIGTLITSFGGGSMVTLTLGGVLFTIFVTELISNTALANLAMPILAATAHALGGDPRLLMTSIGMACSAGFMMPAGTGPNAIAYGTGRVRMADMVRAGFVLNLLAWLVITAITLLRFG